jgi:putative transposase
MRAPVLAAGDGALGFWKAIRDVFPETKEQRCWWHRMAKVLACLPKSAHPGAKIALAEIYNAEDREHALKAVKAFEADYGAKWPKAVAKITDDLDVLLEFYNYPAEHWVHLRTTNPIVIWSRPKGVHHVEHEPVTGRDLRSGCGYLPPSMMQRSRRNGAGSTGGVTCFAARVVDGARGRRCPGAADRALSGVSERYREVAEHREGVRA